MAPLSSLARPHRTDEAGAFARKPWADHCPVIHNDPLTHTLSDVEIPTAFRWVLLALAVLQLVSLLTVLRRLRAAEPAQRVDARIDVLDSVSGFLLLAGLGFAHLPVGVVGLALMGLAILLKGVRFLQARRSA
ncbi:hypothetical protein GCM10010222_15960 [Streptomyces tanashiensis]|nr:hypothetical protein GCM10010222_15960 [Streptomyces tanashiensis]